MKKILFLDILTTGLNSDRCAIYKIGGIFAEDTSEELKLKQRFELCVRPFENARIIDNSLWMGGVTRSRLVHYPDQAEAFKTFMGLIESVINIKNSRDKIYISGFNASAFDVPFLQNWFRMNDNQRFRDCFYVQTLDLASIAAFALLNERQNMPDFHLETTARFLGVTPKKSETYNCADNAQTCAEMYTVLKSRLHIGSKAINDLTGSETFRNSKL